VAVAKTGSGKTLGYLIPGFIHLKRSCNDPRLGPTVLVLSPTRELATQIQVEAVKFGKSSRFSCTVCYSWFNMHVLCRSVHMYVYFLVQNYLLIYLLIYSEFFFLFLLMPFCDVTHVFYDMLSFSACMEEHQRVPS